MNGLPQNVLLNFRLEFPKSDLTIYLPSGISEIFCQVVSTLGLGKGGLGGGCILKILVAKAGEGKFSYEIILGATVFIHHISLKTPAPLGVNKQSVPKLFLAQTARNLLNFSLGVRVYHNFLP